MKTTKPKYRKFQSDESRIEALKKKSPRFKRVFSEYQTMTNELWNLETSEGISVPDDFILSIKQQTGYLEDEIEDWLMQDKEQEQ
ncbi:hypothetical protein [Bergeyella sp. RCAD1439]|uniref:hypothetical protein n=1 Tax=Bergeyella anatis TaxID=3113737 RepID=UPI002E1706EE|nr:hypothetical protein [Bergeyella sp. RCAD1439]